jgi:hypothetical protein
MAISAGAGNHASSQAKAGIGGIMPQTLQECESSHLILVKPVPVA